MTFDLTSNANEPQPDAGANQTTIIALFEDPIDARNALAALRKAGCPAGEVSVIVRDRTADESGPVERYGAVARAVDEAALNNHSGWLLGLAALIVPERGTVLVAGPLGAALAGVTLDAREDAKAPGSAISTILGDFGFAADEAGYVESRLLAGATLIAVLSGDDGRLAVVRRLLAGDNAVHIGRAPTSDAVAHAARALLVSPPEVYDASDVVVTDVVAPMRALVAGGSRVGWARRLHGVRVVDRDGVIAGRIKDLIVDAAADDSDEIRLEQTRYVVVAFGGIFGIRRRHAVLPIDQIALDRQPARVTVAKAILYDAPAFDPTAPFSRREEQVVCAYFGCTPHWLE